MLTIESPRDAASDAALLPSAGDAGFFCPVTPYYQPIVRAGDLSVIGYEALSRGPTDTPLHGARTLFATARTLGEEAALERVCWTAALLNATRHRLWMRDGVRLFLNVSPERIVEPAFLVFVRRLVDEAALDPTRVVIELTEDSLVRPHGHFREALAPYRELGFSVAVDDVGTGCSDLHTVAELRPEFVKLARELVSDVHRHAGRRMVVQSMVALAAALGATLVAEGVELYAELATLRELGVDCVQGYLLGRPSTTPFSAAAEDTLARTA
ncbi:MAG: EAL domain-containing protein [Gemmatimonadetes bacterium]|nr:EAL domain-containing protein [Gemmatimonadota bacterium]